MDLLFERQGLEPTLIKGAGIIREGYFDAHIDV
jgi:hypothetical protein